jgi:hypothetical protein
MKILNRPSEKSLVQAEIMKYDPASAMEVANLIRKEADMEIYVDKLLMHYEQAIENYKKGFRIYRLNRPHVVFQVLRKKLSRVKRKVAGAGTNTHSVIE